MICRQPPRDSRNVREIKRKAHVRLSYLRFGVAVQMCRLEVAIPARSTMGNKLLQQMTL